MPSPALYDRLRIMLFVAPLVVLAPGSEPSETARDPALWSRLRRIETAFRDGDAGALRASCLASGKVRVALQDVAAPQGSYGASQLQVIFGQIFGQSETSEFAFADGDVKLTSSGTAFARGRWVRSTEGGMPAVAAVTFTLRQESGDWRVHEIRSSR